MAGIQTGLPDIKWLKTLTGAPSGSVEKIAVIDLGLETWERLRQGTTDRWGLVLFISKTEPFGQKNKLMPANVQVKNSYTSETLAKAAYDAINAHGDL